MNNYRIPVVLKVLIIAKNRLLLSRGWFKYRKHDLKTSLGLCRLIHNIIKCDFPDESFDLQYIIIKLLEGHASKFGATLHRSLWWRGGRINPRLKTVNSAIEALLLQQLFE